MEGKAQPVNCFMQSYENNYPTISSFFPSQQLKDVLNCKNLVLVLICTSLEQILSTAAILKEKKSFCPILMNLSMTQENIKKRKKKKRKAKW